jgi:pimeloyl-ACP methyl ester carboxylesterase
MTRSPVLRDPAIEERYEEIAGFRTRVLRVTGQGSPLLLLHGFPDSADTWRPVLRLLAVHGRAAVAVDLPSHGKADPLHQSRPMVEQLAEFVGEAARWCDLTRTVVVGNSLGGMLGLLVAEQPSTLAGVVGVCPGGMDYTQRLRTVGQVLGKPARQRAIATAVGAAPVWLVRGAARRFVGRAFFDHAGTDPEFAADYARHVAPRLARRHLFTLLCRLGEEAIVSPLNSSQIACPVMLIWGEHDPLTPSSAARILIDVLPDVRYELLDRVGHMPQQEAPARLVELLKDFPPSG